MKIVTVDRNFSENFGKKYIPKVYINLLIDELDKHKYMPVLSKVTENLNISKQDILNVIKLENIIVSQVDANYIIRFNNVLIKSGVFLEQLIDYINDGDLSFRGCNMFNNAVDYLNNHMRTIYRYYILGGE